MKQKVALVAAFMHKPKILILDEPTSGLDLLMQAKFNILIKKYQENGTTVFMSSHIFGEIENTCDWIAFFKKGKIVAKISINEIKNNPEKKYEIKFQTKTYYQVFLSKKWNIIEKNYITKIVKTAILETNHDQFLKNLLTYEIDQFKELPFNLEEYFMRFYQEEIKFNG